MLVSHTYKFIYTKTVKTAGTSVESYFERFCMPKGDWQQSHQRDEYESSTGIIGYRGAHTPENAKWKNHMPASEIKRHLGETIWNEYYKFCVIRNPFEKCISAFEHFGQNEQLYKRLSISDRFYCMGMNKDQRRFYSFIKHNAPIDRDKYLIDSSFCLNDVIHFESLEEDIAKICRNLSIPYEPEYLPTFKKGIRRADATTKNLYTARTRRLVEEMYDFELEYFNYEYGEH